MYQKNYTAFKKSCMLLFEHLFNYNFFFSVLCDSKCILQFDCPTDQYKWKQFGFCYYGVAFKNKTPCSSTGCSLNIVFFFKISLVSLPPLPRQYHSAAIGCAKRYQPIGVTVHSHAFRALKVGEGLQWIVKKTRFFLNTLYLSFSWNDSAIDLKIKTRNSRNFLYFKAIGVYYTCKKWISYISMNKYV